MDVGTSIVITPTFARFHKTLPVSTHSPCIQISLWGEVGFYSIYYTARNAYENFDRQIYKNIYVYTHTDKKYIYFAHLLI